MKRKIPFLALLFISFYSFSQSITYIDENMKPTDSITYNKKCHSRVLKCLNFKTKTMNINKIIYRYKFGTTDSLGYSQIRKFLLRNSAKKFDGNTFLMIKYKDTLFDVDAIKRNFERHEKSHKEVKHKPFNIKSYNNDLRNWMKLQCKCRTKLKKLGAEIFYVYKYSYESEGKKNEINWIKDRGLFRNTFFKIIYSGNFLLIKPDGEYFISGGHLSNRLLKKLLKNNDWTEFKLDWLNSYNTLSNSGKGTFKSSENHIIHCY